MMEDWARGESLAAYVQPAYGPKHKLGDAGGHRVMWMDDRRERWGLLACTGRTEAQNARRFRSDGSMIFNRAFYLNKTRDSVWRRTKLGKP
jgi:hypothetical protein